VPITTIKWLAGLFLVVVMTLPGRATLTRTQEATPSQKDAADSASRPETADALQALVQDLFKADNNKNKKSQIYTELAIPDAKAWFVKTFGEAEGSRLAAKYQITGERDLQWLRESAHEAVRQSRTYAIVHVIAKPGETTSLLYNSVLAAMANPVSLYAVSNSKGPDDKSPFAFGEFVYVDGGFRYLGGDVMRALSSAPPLRIRIGGKVQQAKLVSKFDPIYPPDAIVNKIQGAVRLHVVLAADGSVMKQDVVSGDPVLAKAAQDAVKQWKYLPTLLNDEPVEVDTEIEVVFALKK